MNKVFRLIVAAGVFAQVVQGIQAQAGFEEEYGPPQAGDGTGGEYGPPPAPSAGQDPSGYRQTLAPHGVWLNHSQYGEVWQPNEASGPGSSWKPYSDGGRWTWTTYGWYWTSGYAWGWLPFHYGRWVCTQDFGWVWSPGFTWGPAWVCWRNTPACYGWAPLPPEAVFEPGIGFRYNGRHVSVEFNFGLPDRHYVFIPVSDFYCAPHVVAPMPQFQVTYLYSTGWGMPPHRRHEYDRRRHDEHRREPDRRWAPRPSEPARAPARPDRSYDRQSIHRTAPSSPAAQVRPAPAARPAPSGRQTVNVRTPAPAPSGRSASGRVPVGGGAGGSRGDRLLEAMRDGFAR